MSDKELTSEWVTRSWEGCGGVSWGDEVADKWPKIVPILRACSGLDLPSDVKEGAVKRLVEVTQRLLENYRGVLLNIHAKSGEPYDLLEKRVDAIKILAKSRAALRDLGVKP